MKGAKIATTIATLSHISYDFQAVFLKKLFIFTKYSMEHEKIKLNSLINGRNPWAESSWISLPLNFFSSLKKYLRVHGLSLA